LSAMRDGSVGRFGDASAARLAPPRRLCRRVDTGASRCIGRGAQRRVVFHPGLDRRGRGHCGERQPLIRLKPASALNAGQRPRPTRRVRIAVRPAAAGRVDSTPVLSWFFFSPLKQERSFSHAMQGSCP